MSGDLAFGAIGIDDRIDVFFADIAGLGCVVVCFAFVDGRSTAFVAFLVDIAPFGIMTYIVEALSDSNGFGDCAMAVWVLAASVSVMRVGTVIAVNRIGEVAAG